MANTMGSAVLTDVNIESLRTQLDNFKYHLHEYLEDIGVIIEKYEQGGIFQKYFKAGNFGEKEYTKLTKIKAKIEEFEDLLTTSGGLISKTNYFIEKADLLNRIGKI